MQQAISSPLLEDVSIDGATGLLINITGGRDMTLQEVNEALTLVHDSADSEAEIIFGSLINEDAKDEVIITIIATGFVSREPKNRIVAPVQVPLIARPSPSVVAAAHAEVASLVPAGKLPPPRTMTGEMKAAAASSPRIAVAKDPALPLDEDQFDIPTFLRRQGHTEMP
jgi:cell division protein FtsZ